MLKPRIRHLYTHTHTHTVADSGIPGQVSTSVSGLSALNSWQRRAEQKVGSE